MIKRHLTPKQIVARRALRLLSYDEMVRLSGQGETDGKAWDGANLSTINHLIVSAVTAAAQPQR